MKILVACEESQRVCIELRKLGHEAYSCDIQEPSGGHPEWHILDDALEVLNPYLLKDYSGFVTKGIRFETKDGNQHIIPGRWDMIIAHPPCTYLSTVATRHHSLKCASLEKINERTLKRVEAMRFFMSIANADCDLIAIENPTGIMNTAYRKPDCIVHPYYFAQSEKDIENYVLKRSCFWLKGLPPLRPTNTLPKPEPFGYTKSGKPINFVEAHGKIRGLECDSDSAKARSKTFPGIAKAMAEQWAGQA